MGAFVLREKLASKQHGKEIYFRRMTAIGPEATDHLEEVARFSSIEEAMQCPASYHALSFYEPHPIEETP